MLLELGKRVSAGLRYNNRDDDTGLIDDAREQDTKVSAVSAIAAAPRLLRGPVLPWIVAVAALGAALLGAIVSDPSGGTVVGGVEVASSASSRLLDKAATPFLDRFEQLVPILLPLAIAFVAGMIATVNPCGFPMLPSYLAMYLGTDETGESQPSVGSRFAKALMVGGIVTAGFIVLFGLTGIALGAGARFLVSGFAWIGLGVGVLLALTGAWVLGGGKLYTGLAQRAASNIGDPASVNIRGYFLFGIAYSTASLSCTLPIFLAVTGISLVTGGSLSAVGLFIAYGLGMGFVISLLTLAIALFKGAMVGALRGMLPHVQRVSAAFMILAGTYLVFYWLTSGGLLNRLPLVA